MTAQPIASHFVDGRYVEDETGAEFVSRHPATGEVIAHLHAATQAVIEAAFDCAARAQKEWAACAPAERGRVLREAARILRRDNQALSELETLDTGKPIQETLVADAASGAEALEYFGGIAAGIAGETIPVPGAHVYTLREPLGVCVGIGAWNYPIQVACWKAAPALACGNAMVFKPSEVTPLTTLKLAEALVEAGAPPGLFNVVQGMGEVGAALAAHPACAKVSLTGSVPTGARVAAQAGARLIPATMELGGKSPLIVFDDADLEDAVGGALLGNFYSAGQVCTNGTRVFVQSGIRDAFMTRLLERTAAIRIGDPTDPDTHMGPLISAEHAGRVRAAIEAGEAEGASRLTQDALPDLPGLDSAAFVPPTIFGGVTDDMSLAREEIFGPVLSLLDFETESEVIARANGTPFGLAAGLFTRDVTRAHRVAAALDAGVCWINCYNLTPVEAPFGGVKASGMGRENSKAAVEFYTRLKTVNLGLVPVDSPY
ncbi:betaine aldehyde dehydrogenase [Albimonas donghaensis]|uniref:Betaine aldehyde dehydrogenase n=1 Tax=Albimonas donghaensis TaxID=356660 RepID=A0A1H2TU56_9RHOB|nr:betaine-aldehyde dehydrogenase [Albimonas donghaensis]SDW47432.1 betaine aldehyde dehydrogenase [Albimonas donghaensis]